MYGDTPEIAIRMHPCPHRGEPIAFAPLASGPSMLSRFLVFLSSHGTAILAGGVFLGLAWPQAAHLLAPMLAPSVFLILTAALVRLDWGATVGYMRRPALFAGALVWMLAVAPVATLGVVALAEPPQGLATAVVLMAAAPPVMAAIAFALLLDLDAPLATVVAFLGTLIAPLTLPPLALVLLDLELQVSVGELMVRLGAIAFGAAVAAALIRRLVPSRLLAARTREIDGLSVLMLLVFAVAIMDGIQATLIARPWFVATAVGLAFAANIALQIAGALLFWWTGARAALTIGLASGNRNMGLLLAALAGTAPFDVVLFFAVGQIPMYVLPALQRAAYRRWLAPRGRR